MLTARCAAGGNIFCTDPWDHCRYVCGQGMREQIFAVWEPVSKNGTEDAGHEGCNRDGLKKAAGA